MKLTAKSCLIALALLPISAGIVVYAQTAAPASASISPDKEKLLDEIEAWRTLVHKDPFTVRYEARLDAIEKAAEDAEDITPFRQSFEDWKNLVKGAKYKVARSLDRSAGLTRRKAAAAATASVKIEVEAAQILSRVPRAAVSGSLTSASPFFDGARNLGGEVPSEPASASVAPAPTPETIQQRGLHINDIATPAPPVTSRPLSFRSLWSHVDWSRGSRVAKAAFRRARGFGERCYHAVKAAFIAAKDELWARIGLPTQSAEIGIPPGLAADYARAVNANPVLLRRLGYRRVDVSSVPNDPSAFPPGTVMVYAPGCAGYNRKAGHIELIGTSTMFDEIPASGRPAWRSDQVLACSDGCHWRTPNYLRTYGRLCMSMYFPVKDG